MLTLNTKQKEELACPIETVEWKSRLVIPMTPYPTTAGLADHRITSILENRQVKRKKAHIHLIDCLIDATNLPEKLAEIVAPLCLWQKNIFRAWNTRTKKIHL